MKAARRHELKENELVRLFGEVREFLQKYGTYVAGGVLIIVVVLAGGAMWRRSHESKVMRAWDRHFALRDNDLVDRVILVDGADGGNRPGRTRVCFLLVPDKTVLDQRYGQFQQRFTQFLLTGRPRERIELVEILFQGLAALRRMDGSWGRSKNEMGTESIVYYSQNGAIEVHSHSIIKEGEAIALPMKRIKRLGAVDATFKTPGLADDEFFLHLASQAGFELRVYTDQHIFIEMPARCVRLYGIVNT